MRSAARHASAPPLCANSVSSARRSGCSRSTKPSCDVPACLRPATRAAVGAELDLHPPADQRSLAVCPPPDVVLLRSHGGDHPPGCNSPSKVPGPTHKNPDPTQTFDPLGVIQRRQPPTGINASTRLLAHNRTRAHAHAVTQGVVLDDEPDLLLEEEPAKRSVPAEESRFPTLADDGARQGPHTGVMSANHSLPHATSAPSRPAAAPGPSKVVRLRLRPATRRALLTVHIIAGVGLLGDVAAVLAINVPPPPPTTPRLPLPPTSCWRCSPCSSASR